MLFPYHDQFWLDVAGFLKKYKQPGELIIAPDEFIDEFPEICNYAVTFARREMVFTWSVVHKGMLNLINRDYLADPKTVGQPVFANEVFVVFTRKAGCPPFDTRSPHYTSFTTQLASLPPWRGLVSSL